MLYPFLWYEDTSYLRGEYTGDLNTQRPQLSITPGVRSIIIVCETTYWKWVSLLYHSNGCLGRDSFLFVLLYLVPYTFRLIFLIITAADNFKEPKYLLSQNYKPDSSRCSRSTTFTVKTLRFWDWNKRCILNLKH